MHLHLQVKQNKASWSFKVVSYSITDRVEAAYAKSQLFHIHST